MSVEYNDRQQGVNWPSMEDLVAWEKETEKRNVLAKRAGIYHRSCALDRRRKEIRMPSVSSTNPYVDGPVHQVS